MIIINNKRISHLVFFILTFAISQAQNFDIEPVETDICIYGGTAAGVTAAIQVARMGHKVVLLEPGKHVGGIAVDGLGGTDINNHKFFKNSAAIGGLSLDFYKKISEHYKIENWEEKNIAPEFWRFESRVADSIYDSWLAEYDIPIYYNSKLILKESAVVKEGTQIKKIVLKNGLTVKAKIFIDATIEGDLIHYAGVTTTTGREANSTYNETKNGITEITTHGQFKVKVDPYVEKGNPESGVIPTIQNEPLGVPGSGDKRIQAYCFRVCLTQKTENKVDFIKPDGYDPSQYEIYLRYMEAGGKLAEPFSYLPNGKVDWNGGHDLSHNQYGMNYEYPEGDYETRERIFKEHQVFNQGLYYFLTHDPAVPKDVRKNWSTWGLCKDEFVDNGNWPRQLYLRDGRRMVSDYVITEHHTKKVEQTPVADPVGIAYWPPDVHNVRRIVMDGYAYNEGFVFGGNEWAPFGISYQALIPKKNEVTNIITPTCPSSSHIGYGAIRIEWTFMVLGQSAATAAVMAIEKSCDLQDIPYDELKKRLLLDNQKIDISKL